MFLPKTFSSKNIFSKALKKKMNFFYAPSETVQNTRNRNFHLVNNDHLSLFLFLSRLGFPAPQIRAAHIVSHAYIMATGLFLQSLFFSSVYVCF